MNYVDMINALFECSGGIFVGLNAYDIWKKKKVAGQTLTAIGFFSAWGFWNLYFYPSLGQWWSMAGGIGMMIMTCVLIGLIIRYRESPKAAWLRKPRVKTSLFVS